MSSQFNHYRYQHQHSHHYSISVVAIQWISKIFITWFISFPVSMINTGWRRITRYPWMYHQRLFVWFPWLLCFCVPWNSAGIFQGPLMWRLSLYKMINNPRRSIRFIRYLCLVVSVTVRKLEHENDYRVTKSPKIVPILIYAATTILLS
jgi:hypothetical protein